MLKIFLTYLNVSFNFIFMTIILFVLSVYLRHKYNTRILCRIWGVLCIFMLFPIKWIFIFTKRVNEISIISNTMFHSIISTRGSTTNTPVDSAYNFGTKFNLSYLQILLTMCSIWLVGIVLLTIKQVILYQKSKMILNSYSSEIKELNILQIFNEEKENLNIKAKIQLFNNNRIPSPTVIGIFSKTIILPTIEMSDSSIRFILRHELIHIKHWDILLKLICLLMKIIHWYNPIAQFIYYEVNMLIEFSCDEEVLLNCKIDQKKQYATTILNEIRLTKKIRTINPNFANTQKNCLKKRIGNILTPKNKANKFVTLCLICNILIGIGFYAYSNSPVDYYIKGATLLNTQKWYLWGNQIRNSTFTTDVNFNRESESKKFLTTKISDEMIQKTFADSCTEIVTKCSDTNYFIPDLITNTADMALFTTLKGTGWKLNTGQSITIQFELDTNTVVNTKRSGSVVEVGYVVDGNITPISEEMGNKFSYNIIVDKDGEYYFYITNHASGYQIIKNGIIKVG